MAALTNSRKTPQYGAGESMVKGIDAPMKASTRIYNGALVARDATGYAQPAGLIAGGSERVLGVACAEVDNSAGAAGALRVPLRRGAFGFKNSAAGDLITFADVGDIVYVVDDQTVAKTDGTGARIAAGVVVGIDQADGLVMVEVGVHWG
jgi:hypothetical protein